jgi:hypothetical protein
MDKKRDAGQKVTEEIKLRNKNAHVRDLQANNLVLEFLDRNPDGVSIKQIVTKTGMSRTTVVKHLERLVALRKVKKRDFGYVSLYYKGGYVDEETAESEKFSNDTSFTFQLVNRGYDGNFVYVQEKQLNEFREEKVTGGIMVNTKDASKFAKMFHTYALKVANIESRQ